MKAMMAWRCRACDDFGERLLVCSLSFKNNIIMVNVIPPNHVDDVPVVEPNQHDDVPVVLDPVLVDEDEDPEEEKFKEEEEPQEEEDDMEIDIEKDENEPELTYPYEEVDPLNPPPLASELELKDVIEVEDTVESEDETVPASVYEVGESSTAPFLREDSDGLMPGLMRRDINSLFGRMLLFQDDLRSSVEEGTAAMANLVKKLGNIEEKAECKKLKKELEEARFSNTLLCSIPINRGLIQAIPTSLPPQPIEEATKASNLRRIPPGVQGRSHFTYLLRLTWTTHQKDDENYAFMASNSSGSNTQREELSDASIEIKAYTQALKKVEAQLVAHQQGQLWYEQKIKFMKIDLDDKTDVLTYHKTLLAKAQKEKDDLEIIVDKWNHSSKNLGKIANYSMSARDKFGLGYGDYRYSGILSYENEVMQSVFKCNKSDSENTSLHKRLNETCEMYAVSPPMTGNYLPSGPDVEIDDSQYNIMDNPHRNLQNKGIIDSGCSRHMTGNKAYLADFQDFNGGHVAFGG
ncbi:hypothetical protein Tco_0271924 [Tanacetum coccineum]